jgi:multidrug resistance efflux pump
MLLRQEAAKAQAAVEVARGGVSAAEARLALARQTARLHPLRLQQMQLTLDAARHRQAAWEHNLRQTKKLVASDQESKERGDALAEQVNEMRSAAKLAESRFAELRQTDPEIPVRETLAELRSARARLRLAESSLADSELRSPEAGTVLTVHARLGEMTGGPGAPPAILFAPNRPHIIRAEIEQEFVSFIEQGQQVVIEDDAPTGKSHAGVVRRVGEYFRRRQLRADPTQFSDIPTLECIIDPLPGNHWTRIGQRVRVKCFDHRLPASAKEPRKSHPSHPGKET